MKRTQKERKEEAIKELIELYYDHFGAVESGERAVIASEVARLYHPLPISLIRGASNHLRMQPKERQETIPRHPAGGHPARLQVVK